MANWAEATLTGRGYPDWEAANDGAGAGDRIVPVFVELAAGLDPAPLLAAVDAAGGTVSGDELDRLATERAAVAVAGGGTLRLVVHLPRRALAVAGGSNGARIRHVGPALAKVLHASAVPQPTSAGDNPGIFGGLPLLAPLAAVIDDGIPFLGARFRRSAGATRFHAVWLQADERVGSAALPGAMAGPGPGLTAGPDGGVILTRQAIDAMLTGGSEADHYRRLNRALLPVTERASTNHRTSHGAHVIDIAAGADPGNATDPMQAVDLLAVQLPPAAIADTSGRRNEGRIIQGLRWCVLEALRRNRNTGRSPLIVTLSLGSLAGAGDDSGFLANWLGWEARRYHALTGCEMRIVCAYGNDHRHRLVARGSVGPDTPMALDWRVEPDDHSSSFLELRCPRGAAAALSVTLVPPGKVVPPLTLSLGSDKARIVTLPGGPVAACYPMAEPGPAALLFAIAPTARLDGGAVAPAGAWKVLVRSGAGPAVVVTAKVQRDDTPAGYRRLGRQSWLDHPLAWDWDEQTRDWTRPYGGTQVSPPQPPCPVSRQGTAAAHAGATDPAILFAGSVKPRIGYPDDRVSSLYSAEGVGTGRAESCQPGLVPHQSGESAGPTLAALADDGSNLYGRRAGGVLSGSTARQSGTSVAAPGVARALVLALLAGAPDPLPVAAEKHPLTGYGILPGQRPYERGDVVVP